MNEQNHASISVSCDELLGILINRRNKILSRYKYEVDCFISPRVNHEKIENHYNEMNTDSLCQHMSCANSLFSELQIVQIEIDSFFNNLNAGV